MSAIVRDSPSATNAPLSHVRSSRPRSAPASRCALARIFSVALTIAADVPGDGLVLNPCPEPKRFSSAGTTFTSSAGTPSSPATSCAYSPSRPSASVVRLSTIFPVGWTRRNTARYASSATACLLLQPHPLLMGGQRVVLFLVAEARRRSAGRIRRHHGAVAAGVDARFHRLHPGVVLPRLGP